MTRRVVITGLGPVSGIGMGIDEVWDALCAGRSGIARLETFDPSGFSCQLACEIKGFKVKNFVPKSYRKATKVMARDIELAVAAADYAAKDAGLQTPGTAGDDGPRSYDASRVSAQIGAGLIAADVEELTMALAESAKSGSFDIHEWGKDGMNHLTPLWLLKYLPNMLASHVAIIHDTQGPSNTITCGNSSSGLSIGESLRVIQRGKAEAGLCGGIESKLNVMAYKRQEMSDRLSECETADGVRPFDENADGMVIGEGGGIVVLEETESYENREKPENHKPYAEVVGFGASQTVHRESRNWQTDPEGRAIANAIKIALHEADANPDEIDMIVAYGSGMPGWDAGEVAAYRKVFGDRLKDIPVITVKAFAGNCGSGGGGLDVCVAAKAIKDGKVPAIINRDAPLEGIGGNQDSQDKDIRHALIISTGFGGQNTAILLKKYTA